MEGKKKNGRQVGRPVGTKNSEAMIVDLVPAACPRCKSTERASVCIVRERIQDGQAPNGQPRTHIIWRRVRCKSCGQYFIEMEHQNRVPDDK